MSGSYYSLLGINPSASTEDVRSAYLALVRLLLLLATDLPGFTSSNGRRGSIIRIEHRQNSGKRRPSASRNSRAPTSCFPTVRPSPSSLLCHRPTLSSYTAASREVYDRTLLAPASPEAQAGALVPFEPPQSRSSSSQPSRPAPQPRSYTSSIAESVFPGYRIPPGGYPRAHHPPTSQTRFPPAAFDVPAALNPFTGLSSPLSASSPRSHSGLALQQSEPLDDALMALSLRDRDRYYLDRRDDFDDRYRHNRPGDWEWIDDGRGGGPCKTAKKEWGEVKREWNGDKVVRAFPRLSNCVHTLTIVWTGHLRQGRGVDLRRRRDTVEE